MPDGSASAVRRGGPGTALLGVVGGVLLFLVVVVALVVIGSRGEGASQVPPAVNPPEVEVAGANGSPSPEPRVASDGERATALAAEREPSEDDAAAFTASYSPPGGEDVESIIIDLDSDGRNEVVVVSIVDAVSRVDVALWDGRRYVVGFTGQGGPAEVIEAFTVRDATGDGSREIVVEQFGDGRSSLALWGVTAEGVARQAARGGCWDGSHVYGWQGVEVEDGELVASCDPSADDVGPGGRSVYRWDDGAWVAEETDAD